MGEIICNGIGCQTTWRPSLLEPIFSLDELLILFGIVSASIQFSSSVTANWRASGKCKKNARPSNMVCLFTYIYWSVDEVIVENIGERYKVI
jgi:hypothetical protein